jgi:hypothetical protein
VKSHVIPPAHQEHAAVHRFPIKQNSTSAAFTALAAARLYAKITQAAQNVQQLLINRRFYLT